jgi:hypothetical protein
MANALELHVSNGTHQLLHGWPDQFRHLIPFFGGKINIVKGSKITPQKRAGKSCFLCQNGAAAR